MPTGLAVGLALKEFALRRTYYGDSPQESLSRLNNWVPPLRDTGCAADSAGYDWRAA